LAGQLQATAPGGLVSKPIAEASDLQQLPGLQECQQQQQQKPQLVEGVRSSQALQTKLLTDSDEEFLDTILDEPLTL
jgi:hypothetical protein